MARCARCKTWSFYAQKQDQQWEKHIESLINSLKLTSVLLAAMANSVEKTQTENTPAVEFMGAIRKKIILPIGHIRLTLCYFTHCGMNGD